MKTIIGIALLFSISLVPVPMVYDANAQPICSPNSIEQITDEPDGFSEDPSPSSNGDFIAFQSDADINGGNPEGNTEIFLYNMTTGTISQITDEPSGSSSQPSINSDGTRIAFQSNANINNTNPDGSTEIYLFDTTGGTFTRITDAPFGDFSLAPSINADGTRIAFESDANINGSNPEGNREIFLFDTTTGFFTQLIVTVDAFSAGASINADGTRIAFASGANINNGNPDENFEIFLYDTNTSMLTQITSNPTGESTGAAINGDGTRIGFNSFSNINGGNPEGNREIYMFNTATGTTTQYTNTSSGQSFSSSINGAGTLLAFTSDANINGGNPDGNREVYVVNTESGLIIQITDTVSGNTTSPAITSEGNLLAFDGDILGNPDDNFEIFITSCFVSGTSIPTLSQWGLIAMAGILGIAAYMILRRRTFAV